MGTWVRISIWTGSTTHAASITQQIENQLKQQGIDWYPWSEDSHSELRRLNAALNKGATFNASDDLLQLLKMSMRMHLASEGFFDPAVMPMTAAWGFANYPQPTLTTLPSTTFLRSWQRSRPKLTDLILQDHFVSSARHDLQLDLGAIAKGYALDLVKQHLHQSGISQACINLGGQLLVIGKSLPATCTWIHLQNPRSNDSLGKIKLMDGESISTSGDYQRNALVDGNLIHHLLDPYTGAPVPHTQSVTVIASSAALADAASTALMAAGPAHWRAIAKKLGIREALRIDTSGKIEVSTALYSRLTLSPQTLHSHPIQLVAL